MFKHTKYYFLPLLCMNIIFGNNKLEIINADYLENFSKNNQTIQKLYGNVVLKTDDITLFTENANFYKDLNEFHLNDGVTMIKDDDTLKCLKMIHIDKDNTHIKAIGNIIFTQNKSEQKIFCDSLYYWPDSDSSIAYSNVKLIKKDTKLHSDKLTIWETNGYRKSSFIANGNCKIFENTKIIIANEISYNDSIQLMSLNDSCSFKESNRGMSGDFMMIQYQDSLLKQAEIINNAYAYNIFDIIGYKKNVKDVMKANKLFSTFRNDKIDSLKLFGMATTTYHLVEDSVLKGLNNASGDTINISFENDEIERLQIFGGGRGSFIPDKNNSQIDSTIIYNGEFIDYIVKEKKTFLKNNANVLYQKTTLSSDIITADWNANLLEVFKSQDNIPIVDTNDGEPLSGDYMEFDLISKQGRIKKGKTNYNNSVYYGREIYRNDNNVFHVHSSKYTSCDAEEPHFYLASRKMKMITGERIVAKPLWLYIYDIPIIGFPLAILPNKGGGRQSGWIMPSFGHRNSDGTFFQGLGYFWAPNDYLDSRLLTNFYDKKGIQTYTNINYVKRYIYNGSLNSTLSRTILSEDISNVIGGNLNQKWDLKWKHNWTIDPTQNLNINWTYMSNNSYYQDTTFSHNQETRLNQRLESSANFSKRWPQNKNTISINISESTDLLNSEKTSLDNASMGTKIFYKSRYFPRISFRHSQSKLFGNGSKWYNNLYWSISSSMTRTEKIGWEADSDSSWVQTDRKKNTDQIINHSLSLSAPKKYFGWLTLNPKLNIKEDWIFKYKDYYATSDTTVDFIYVNKFLPRHTGSASISANTKIYGILPISFFNLKSIRHVLSPSLSFSWKPDFSKTLFGYNFNYFESINGNDYDKFSGSMAGSTSKQEQKSISISLNNQFQTKILNNENDFKKIDLFNWNLNTSYNFAADSLKLSPIRSSIRTTLPGGFRLDISMTHDPYKLKLNSDNQLKRVNKFGKPRLTSASCGTSLKLYGSQKNYNNYDSLQINNDSILVNQSKQNKRQNSKKNLWESSLSLRYSLTQFISGNDINDKKTFWMNSTFKINLTEKWSLQHTARFDLIKYDMIYHKFHISRPLHCWVFSFNWTPNGPSKGFYLKINVKNPDLQDIKLESRGGKSFYNL